ncbi:PilN domain-containing protein [Rhizobacter sp. Root404]|uniref:PilN domain-containing protein n=1 Tax=Rhizobacter sp. Root404 TaxID=1736528 RepID=UPI00070071B3|nr:PilN domain-containing protein [Rhizobacter sp. Root404]KQW40089.1 fimbrial assembly protein [Rhizobacter sp. Root404]
MILINLLPHREERRKRRKIAFFAGLGVAAVVGLGIVGGWYLVVEQLKSAQQDRNKFLATEIAKLELEIKDIANLKAEIASLVARQKAVEDLQTDRNVPVHILNELVRQTPEGMYFTAMRQDGQILNITGIAQTQERISEFLRNTAYNSEWLVKPELIESKATVVTGANREQKRLFDFSMRLTVKRPQDKAAAQAIPASAPASAAAAAKKA